MSNLMLDVIKDEVSEARENKSSTPHFLAGIIMQENRVASIEGNLCIYDSTHNYWKTLKSDNYDKTIRLLIPKEYRAKCNSAVVNEILRWMDTYAEEINLKKIHGRNEWINFRDGCYNVMTYEVEEQTPELYFQHYINADIPSGEPWKEDKITGAVYTQFVDSVFKGEYRGLKKDFEELLGVIFSAQRSLKISSIFWGKPNTGKSVALNMISDMFATTAVSNVSFSQFSEEFAVANLVGKALNVSGEISGIRERRMDLFNSIVGNDTIMACFKGKDYFKLKSNAFLAFACNDLPVIPPEVVDAFSTRVVIFPFMNAVPRDSWITDMNIKMRKEVELITAKAILGLRRFIENGNRFTHQEQLDLIKMDALCNLNSFKAFADRELVVDKKSFTSSHDITTAYEAFCEEYDLEVYSVQRWSGFLRQMFPKVKKTTKKDDFDFQKRGYEGIRLIHAEDNETVNILRENPNSEEG